MEENMEGKSVELCTTSKDKQNPEYSSPVPPNPTKSEAAALDHMKCSYIDIEASKAAVSSEFLTEEVWNNSNSTEECNDSFG